jgi:hypothetical protein
MRAVENWNRLPERFRAEKKPDTFKKKWKKLKKPIYRPWKPTK